MLNQWKLEPNGTADGVTAPTRTLLDTTLAIRSDALFVLRIHVSPDVSQMMVGGGADGKVHDSGRPMPSPASDEWVPRAAAGLIGLLEKIDELYLGRIIGVHMASLRRTLISVIRYRSITAFQPEPHWRIRYTLPYLLSSNTHQWYTTL